jgi:hypothetical protein
MERMLGSRCPERELRSLKGEEANAGRRVAYPWKDPTSMPELPFPPYLPRARTPVGNPGPGAFVSPSAPRQSVDY